MFTARPALTDPFLDLIGLLRPRATLWGGLHAAGRWGVSFRQHEDLLFCWIEQGECLLTRPLLAPLKLRIDDFVLIRTTTPFTLTSDPTVEPQDSETVVAATQDPNLRLGQGTEAPVTLRGGRFVFDSANENLLTGLLASLVHITSRDTASWRIRSYLKMNEMESLGDRPGREFVIARLMELILVEILRGDALRENEETKGLLAGLADPVTALALSAMHRDIAHDWTVSSLAHLCGVSRSTFATRFHKIVGMGPIEYLQQWRIAVAKDELRRGTRSINDIAFAVGFQSSSAFSTAFSRAVGRSPKNFAMSAD